MALKRNVLIFHSGALGDFVLSWPLAMAAGRLFAQSRIFYIAGKQKGQLAEKALRLESIDVESGWHSLFAEQPDLPPTPQKLLAGAHTIVGFVSDRDSLWERNVRAAAPDAEVLTLAAHPPANFAGHHTEFLLQQLAGSMVWQQSVTQLLTSLRTRGLGITPKPDGPVVLHPGSGGVDKCWPLQCYVQLAQSLQATGRRVRFVVGEVEQERWPEAELKKLGTIADLHQLTTLVELHDLLKEASAFVGNDSGPGHLAGMLGLPTVSLFGPTDPVRWQPIGPNVKVIRHQPLTSLAVEDVAAAI